MSTKRVSRQLSELKAYPKQNLYFPLMSDEDVTQLAADIQANGLKTPIDILPDGTIVSGHTRVKAVKSLGWTEIDCIVHPELADDPDGAEVLFVQENAIRRQLSPLQRARCAKRLIELEMPQKKGRIKADAVHQKTRDKVGKLLGLSGRHVDRLLTVLKTPAEVQTAFEAGVISIALACRVAALREDVQQQIAAEIRAKKYVGVKEIIEAHLPRKAASGRGADRILLDVLRPLKDAIKELPGHERGVIPLSASSLAILREGKELLEQIIDLQEKHMAEEQEYLASEAAQA